jgi:hypothetical protein
MIPTHNDSVGEWRLSSILRSPVAHWLLGVEVALWRALARSILDEPSANVRRFREREPVQGKTAAKHGRRRENSTHHVGTFPSV